MPRILLLESLEETATARLRERAEVHLAYAPDDFSGALEHGPFDALITRGKGRVDSTLLDQIPGLKVIARCGVGLDNIDVDACTARGIPVINAPGATTIAVAEQCLFLILATVRKLHPVCSEVKAGNWAVRDSYDGDDLFQKRLGLIGMGDIASRLAPMAAACGMDVAFWNHRLKDSPFPQLELDELLARSDILSLHVPLNEQTRHFIDAGRLEQLPRGAHLINTARGAQVDNDAVLAALESGQLASYAADVFDPEPPQQDHPLPSHPNTLITPHNAALSRGSYARMSLRTVNNVMAALSGNQPEKGCIFNAAQL